MTARTVRTRPLHDVVDFRVPRWVPDPVRLRLFEVWDRAYAIRFRSTRWVPVYVGPISYEGRWFHDWRYAEAVQLGMGHAHLALGWEKPGPDHWFWGRR